MANMYGIPDGSFPFFVLDPSLSRWPLVILDGSWWSILYPARITQFAVFSTLGINNKKGQYTTCEDVQTDWWITILQKHVNNITMFTY